MTSRSFPALLVALCLCAAGGCFDVPERESSRHAVLNGAVDTGDPAVGAIYLRRQGCGDLPVAALCTGTLIGPRVVITAAHCVQGLKAGALEVSFGDAVGAPAAARHQVLEVAVHPDFRPETFVADVALLRLDRVASATPVPLLTEALDASRVGETVRVVGFGETRDDLIPVGTKVEGSVVITSVDATSFTYAPDPAMTCRGDSGGPGFVADGPQEWLAGVTSFGDPACASDGVNIRVDPLIDTFIQPFLDAGPPVPTVMIERDAICAAPCGSDADCPDNLVCEENLLPARCVLANVPPGDFGSICRQDDDCPGSALCLRLQATDPDGCRCFSPCEPGVFPPDDKGGCHTAPGPDDSGAPLVLFALLLLCRRRVATSG